MENIELMTEEIWRAMPGWGLALILLLIGWCAAIVTRMSVTKALELGKFNHACEKTGFADFLRKGQVSYTPARLVGVIAYWMLLLVVLSGSARLLNIKIVELIYERFTAAMPGFLAAVLIVTVGVVIASFIGNFVMTIARNAGFPHAQLVSRLIKWLGLILVVGLGVEQMDIGTKMLSSVFLVFLGAVALGLALAFGLGCKDMARDSAERLLQHLREQGRADKKTDMEG